MLGLHALQVAVYDKLRTYAPLTTLLGTFDGGPAIFDGPLQPNDAADGTPHPYLSIGYVSGAPFDTDTEVGSSATVTVHTWGEGHALSSLSPIMDEVYAALHRAELSISGMHFIGCDIILTETTRDPDGVTLHGIQRFLITFEEI